MSDGPIEIPAPSANAPSTTEADLSMGPDSIVRRSLGAVGLLNLTDNESTTPPSSISLDKNDSAEGSVPDKETGELNEETPTPEAKQSEAELYFLDEYKKSALTIQDKEHPDPLLAVKGLLQLSQFRTMFDKNNGGHTQRQALVETFNEFLGVNGIAEVAEKGNINNLIFYIEAELPELSKQQRNELAIRTVVYFSEINKNAGLTNDTQSGDNTTPLYINTLGSSLDEILNNRQRTSFDADAVAKKRERDLRQRYLKSGHKNPWFSLYAYEIAKQEPITKDLISQIISQADTDLTAEEVGAYIIGTKFETESSTKYIERELDRKLEELELEKQIKILVEISDRALRGVDETFKFVQIEAEELIRDSDNERRIRLGMPAYGVYEPPAKPTYN